MSFDFRTIKAGEKMDVGVQPAFRFWRYVFQPDVALLSWVASTRWYPGHTVEATNPDFGEQGIHGFKTMDDLRFALRYDPDCLLYRAHLTHSDGIVIGTVDLFGIIWDHAKGFRAQFARPTSFISAHGGRSDEALSELRGKFLR